MVVITILKPGVIPPEGITVNSTENGTTWTFNDQLCPAVESMLSRSNTPFQVVRSYDIENHFSSVQIRNRSVANVSRNHFHTKRMKQHTSRKAYFFPKNTRFFASVSMTVFSTSLECLIGVILKVLKMESEKFQFRPAFSP